MPGVSRFLAAPDISLLCVGEISNLHRTSHPSGSRLLRWKVEKTFPLSILPLPPFSGPENQRFHTVSNGLKLTDLMVLNQPYGWFTAWAVKKLKITGRDGCQSDLMICVNPIAGSPSRPILMQKVSFDRSPDRKSVV